MSDVVVQGRPESDMNKGSPGPKLLEFITERACNRLADNDIANVLIGSAGFRRQKIALVAELRDAANAGELTEATPQVVRQCDAKEIVASQMRQLIERGRIKLPFS